jgi:hypothetical protein
LPKKHAHAAAQILAGEVFGKILDREADAGGYAYVLDCLESGQKSLQQIVIEFVTSDEFIDRFLSAATPAQSVDLVRKLLLDPSPGSDVQPESREFVRTGLQAYVEKIVASADYAEHVGPDRVPGFGHAPRDVIEPPQDSPPPRRRRERGT